MTYPTRMPPTPEEAALVLAQNTAAGMLQGRTRNARPVNPKPTPQQPQATGGGVIGAAIYADFTTRTGSPIQVDPSVFEASEGNASAISYGTGDNSRPGLLLGTGWFQAHCWAQFSGTQPLELSLDAEPCGFTCIDRYFSGAGFSGSAMASTPVFQNQTTGQYVQARIVNPGGNSVVQVFLWVTVFAGPL